MTPEQLAQPAGGRSGGMRVLITGLVMGIMFLACASNATAVELSREEVQMHAGASNNWVVIKSPITGKCYEVFSYRVRTQFGSVSMSEVECETWHMNN